MRNNQSIDTKDKFSEYVIKSKGLKSYEARSSSDPCEDFFSPTATAGVAPITGDHCLYLFTLTVRKGQRNISGGTFTFTLADGFTELTDINPANAEVTFDSTTGTGVWTFEHLIHGKQSRTVTFRSRYTGDVGVAIYEAAQARTNGGTMISTSISNLITVDCSSSTCCEECNEDEYTDFPTTPCNDSVENTVTPRILPKGRMLFVTLDTPKVCNTKDINIGIFVTEVQDDGSETAFAHRIIRRPATGTSGDLVDDRDCSCVQFMIDDDETTAAIDRTFRVRTVAHYVDKPTDSYQCQCGDCNRP